MLESSQSLARRRQPPALGGEAPHRQGEALARHAGHVARPRAVGQAAVRHQGGLGVGRLDKEQRGGSLDVVQQGLVGIAGGVGRRGDGGGGQRCGGSRARGGGLASGHAEKGGGQEGEQAGHGRWGPWAWWQRGEGYTGSRSIDTGAWSLQASPASRWVVADLNRLPAAALPKR